MKKLIFLFKGLEYRFQISVEFQFPEGSEIFGLYNVYETYCC